MAGAGDVDQDSGKGAETGHAGISFNSRYPALYAAEPSDVSFDKRIVARARSF